MPHRDFDTLFEELESNLAFSNNDAFMNELKDSIKTLKQWCKIAELLCKSYNKFIVILLD